MMLNIKMGIKNLIFVKKKWKDVLHSNSVHNQVHIRSVEYVFVDALPE